MYIIDYILKFYIQPRLFNPSLRRISSQLDVILCLHKNWIDQENNNTSLLPGA